MTGSGDVAVPHPTAEQSSRNPSDAADQFARGGSRAADQLCEEPMHPSPADEGMPAADSNHPETVSQDGRATDGPAARVLAAEVEPDRPQAGVPVGAVTDETPALGTSETMKPVQGVHRPEVGT